jgi:predicted transcriptional regulator
MIAYAIIRSDEVRRKAIVSRTVQLNTRVDEQTADALDRLARLTGRTKARLFYEAITSYISRETSFLREVEEARASIQAGDYYTLDTVVAELDSLIAQAEARQQQAS